MAGEICATGFVIKNSAISEYDSRIVLLTKELGKVSAFARGARKMNSPLMGVTQPFVFGTFTLFEGRTYFRVKSADIKRYFRGVTADLDAVLYACYFAEIADYYGKEGLDASDGINVLYAGLAALEKKQMPYPLIRCVYEIRAIETAGELQDLTKYTGEIEGDAPDLRQILLYTIQFIETTPLSKVFSFTVREDVQKRLGTICRKLCERTFEWPMRSARMLDDNEK
ncbi:MAG: DNA repair protein RecO [Lachnospiraceae bacterium]|jgi:DNA repair protein RecO (recombination protein O)